MSATHVGSGPERCICYIPAQFHLYDYRELLYPRKLPIRSSKERFFAVDFIFRGETGYINQISAQKYLVSCAAM